MQNERTSKEVSTDDERVMAISQILNGQYHIWDICVRPENKVFCWKINQIHFPKDGTHSAKIVKPKYHKCPKIYKPNLSAQAQKIGISLKKGFIRRP